MACEFLSVHMNVLIGQEDIERNSKDTMGRQHITERQLTSSCELLILCGLAVTYHLQSISFNDRKQDYFSTFTKIYHQFNFLLQ